MRMMLALALMLVTCEAAAAAELPSWMAGTWRGESSGVRMEEHWSAPDGGLMLGLHRDISPKRTSFEFMRIEQQGEALVLLAQPGGKAATAFPLKSLSRNRIVFENLQHDFPQRVIYWLSDDDRLCARVEDAKTGEQWCWMRADG